MSQKNLRKKRQTAARPVPVKTICTRYKSSQSSQQKKISQDQNETVTTYSRTYVRSAKNTAKSNVKEKQIQETKETEINKEFYPDKLKRLFQKKEIVLKRKPAYKLVGGMGSINKRKLRKPTKEISMEQSIVFPEECDDSKKRSKSNIIDLICLDDSDSLDEEDLMEILTCPSPVWWEDPPNDLYDEEPLSITINNKDYNIKLKDQNVKYAIREEHNNLHNNEKDKNHGTINIVSHNRKEDKNFVVRQNKLESLLGNIKNKKIDNDTFEKINNKSSCSSPDTKLQNKSSECLAVDEEILKTLENIAIPVEKLKHEMPDEKVQQTSHTSETPKECKTESTPNISNKSRSLNIKPLKGLTIKKCDIKQFESKPNKKRVISNKEIQSIKDIEENKMIFLKTWSEQCDMKVLSNINEQTEVHHSQPKLSQAQNKVSGITIKNYDPTLISKQNKSNKKRKRNDKKSNNKIAKKVTTQNRSCSETPNADDQITVYKILSDQELEGNKESKIESSKTYNTQLNSYYNQCKNINKCKKETDNKQSLCDSDKQSVCNNNQMVKSIAISNDETVKYCLQCSSIFDNDICNYCAIKSSSDAKVSSKIVVKADAS